MGIGLGIFLVVVGAVLRFGITADVQGIDLGAIGIILMLAGGAIVVLTVMLTAMRGGKENQERLPGDNRTL
ncbi:DUF6458 family protein [Nocardiopsis ansamitocini]|uniref:DUF6458 domain-containing protein n=1 Tax=Nocardiopsis ansamitocini TaxID=1670832 RepID=A0A9W6P5C1_9ACTN|nr:DUF6458 family protein [Nocardiopsis ansamitocini]GLU47303.1 hypothetical protein Nans01_16540 [Nocardiopsis ansamitocini]